jgi:uncharacterized protein
MCWFLKKRKQRKEAELLAKQAKDKELLEKAREKESAEASKTMTPNIEPKAFDDTALKPEEPREEVKPHEKINTPEVEIEVKTKKDENIEEEQEKVLEGVEVEKLKTENYTQPELKVATEDFPWPEEKKEDKTKVESKNQYSGKYEVYPEAGSYKYRLKASNGEILAVSFRYSTEKGAISGIETFKKNVETGIFEITTDKSNYSKYNLFNSNGARVVIIGEFYNSYKQAESAVESVKKFYNTEKIDILDEIPESEVREELANLEKVDELSNGKYELYEKDGLYFIKLKANNAQILFISQGYSSKSGAKLGLETIKKAIFEDRFTVGKDKQNRYQFNLYSSTNQLILSGETYPSKASCVSAINSVRNFAGKAKLIEI